MKPSGIAEALRVLIRARQPAFIWSSPGCGKSAVTVQVASGLNLQLRDVRALLLDPVDLRGLPFLGSDGRSKWATPDFLPQDGEGVLFLDELNAAPAMVQASCYQLVLDSQSQPREPMAYSSSDSAFKKYSLQPNFRFSMRWTYHSR